MSELAGVKGETSDNGSGAASGVGVRGELGCAKGDWYESMTAYKP